MKQSILFIDDEPRVLKAYERALRSQSKDWEMDFETSPQVGLQRVKAASYDTLVTDMRMPGMSGLDLLQAIKKDPALSDLPVVIVTGDGDKQLKRRALDMDAADLLKKPVETEELIARLRSALRMKEYSDALKQHNKLLEVRVQERTAELEESRIDIIWRLGKAAEYRDEETGNHVIRVGCYSRAVGRSLKLDEHFCNTLFLAAPLHDIGKIGIPDSILLKPGKLADEEWIAMRSHCQIGASILNDRCKLMPIAARIGCKFADSFTSESTPNPVIEMAATIAISHHERWDGTGYPNGLSGDEIPLVGRIVAVADVYDALRSRRPYKEPMDTERALEVLSEGAGSHFDPNVVDAFHQAFGEIEAIEREFSDDAMLATAIVSSDEADSEDLSRLPDVAPEVATGPVEV